jgi:16S rRNA C967 or C1407 C5-methylase (RsmB/RsmF family)
MLFAIYLFNFSSNASVWDCCAGAGGKSLLIKELNPKIKLTVSDKRASVLENLLERFQVYQFDRPQYFELSLVRYTELTGKNFKIP